MPKAPPDSDPPLPPPPPLPALRDSNALCNPLAALNNSTAISLISKSGEHNNPSIAPSTREILLNTPREEGLGAGSPAATDVAASTKESLSQSRSMMSNNRRLSLITSVNSSCNLTINVAIPPTRPSRINGKATMHLLSVSTAALRTLGSA